MKKLLLVAALCGVTAPAFAQSPYDALPGVDTLPADVVQVSPTVPGMGEHWANPATLPLGPIYCVHQGKIVCLEFMISQEELASGKSWPVLAGKDGLPTVNHTSIGFQEHGHEGFEVPHYDIHMFFLSPEEVAKIQP